MPRVARIAPGDVIFQVLNRGNPRSQIFEKDQDYEAFQRVLAETARTTFVRILAYCIKPNHWHMFVAPTRIAKLALSPFSPPEVIPAMARYKPNDAGQVKLIPVSFTDQIRPESFEHA